MFFGHNPTDSSHIFKYVYNSSHNCVGNNIVVVLLVLVKIYHIMTQRYFMFYVVGLNPIHGEVYSIKHYVIKFVSD
jgi:hypothetical protein